jgi:PIN domain nuclease of toxin-antitoxin system
MTTRMLLDSQVFLWVTGKSHRIPDRTRKLLNQVDDLYLSVITEGELTIKQQVGKLRLPIELSEIIRLQCEANGLHILPITRDHVHQYSTLPLHP